MFENTINLGCKGRKDHKCALCGNIIKKGEIHVSYSTKSNGYYKTIKYHKDCEIEHQKNLSEAAYKALKNSIKNNPGLWK